MWFVSSFGEIRAYFLHITCYESRKEKDAVEDSDGGMTGETEI